MPKLRKLCLFLCALLTTTYALSACDAPFPSVSFSGDSFSDAPYSGDVSDSIENSDNDSSSDSNNDADDSSDSSDTPTAEQLWAETVMTNACELSAGESLEGVYQLSGVITEIDITYTSSKGVCLYFNVDEPQQREMYCYQLKGDGAGVVKKGDWITVSGTIKNYKGMIEFEKGTLVAYTLADGTQGGDDTTDLTNDPYQNVSKSEFYADYTVATDAADAYYRSLHGFMSGELTTPDQAPTISAYQPKQNEKFIRNSETKYTDDGNGYIVVDSHGNTAFTVYKSGAYITLEEVAAYVYAFGTYPANYTTSKNTDPSDSVWGEYLRLNHTAFSGDTSRFPYEPVLPNISGCGGTLHYYEMDIGTTGTDCDPSYSSELYNDGNRITRGAARIVYGKEDLNKNGVYELNEWYVFYTYNHYNDFQEYLNYQGGWGEMFGNITGGGTISSKYECNPTDYVDICFAPLPSVSTVQALATTRYSTSTQVLRMAVDCA